MDLKSIPRVGQEPTDVKKWVLKLLFRWDVNQLLPSSDTLLREAYEEGVDLFISKLTKDKGKHAWIHAKHDISDIWKLADQAKEKYEAKGESKVSEWISKFSCRMQYYSPIMDTVCNPRRIKLHDINLCIHRCHNTTLNMFPWYGVQ